MSTHAVVRPTVHRAHAAHALLLAAVLLLTTGLTLAVAPSARAATFDPGMIIGDALFYDAGSMSAPQIQAFLDAKAPTCRPGADGTPCLRSYREDTFTRPADDRCTGSYTGTGNESAAQIIAKVSVACRISPKVILVMLQKEQSLVTASGNQLYPSRYRSAMGFGCPDTAPCDARYYGFYNQVYQAAWQLRNYALNPARYSHRVGVVNNVRYHPNAACGTGPVLILNQATASLYNYTPYQPNNAALAAGFGTGDACSAYGNRNFFNYYQLWFGSGNSAPIGVIDVASATNTTLTVSGWTLDPDSSLSNEAHVYVDGQGVSLRADAPRPDVAAVYGLGAAHGYSVTLPVRPGSHQVCVYGTSVGFGDTVGIGCRTVVVPDQVPIGEITSVVTAPNQVTLSGWTLDADAGTASNDVHVYIDGAGVSLRADQSRPDIATRYGLGDKHGFSHVRSLAPGVHSMCVYAINTSLGANTVLGCSQFLVRATDAPPVGVIDAITPTAGGVTMSGWAFDPDSSQSTEVHVYVDGVGLSLPATGLRPDVGAVYGRGPATGWSTSWALAPGQHSMCAYSIGAAGGGNTLIGCRTFVVPDRAPIGVIDSVTTTAATAGAPGSVTVTGWTFDPDSPQPNQAHIYIDGVGVSLLADRPRPDVGAVYGRGPNNGYTWTAPLAAGSHALCVYGITSAAGANTLLGCRSFVVP